MQVGLPRSLTRGVMRVFRNPLAIPVIVSKPTRSKVRVDCIAKRCAPAKQVDLDEQKRIDRTSSKSAGTGRFASA